MLSTSSDRVLPWELLGTRVTDHRNAQSVAAAAEVSELNTFAFFDVFVDEGHATYCAAGATQRSREVWIIARLVGDLEIYPGDYIARFVLLVQKLSSTRGPTIGCRPMRLANSVTFRDALLYPVVRTTQTPPEPAHLEDAPEVALQKLELHFDKVAERFRAMTRIVMNSKRLTQYYEKVFPNPDPPRNQRHRDLLEKRPAAIAECQSLFLDGEGNNLPGARGTLWAALNAVAEYVDYKMVADHDPDRLAHVWGSPLKTYAFMEANRLVCSVDSES